MTTSDTAAALASALPVSIWDNQSLAEHQADRLAEQGWVLVRPDDEATVERVAKTLHRRLYYGSLEPYMPHDDVWRDLAEAKRAPFLIDARRALAALAARPGGADTEQTEVDRG